MKKLVLLASVLVMGWTSQAMADPPWWPNGGGQSPPNPSRQYQGYGSFNEMWAHQMQKSNTAQCTPVHGAHRSRCCDNNRCWYQ